MRVALQSRGDEGLKHITFKAVGLFCMVRGDCKFNNECRIMLVAAGGVRPHQSRCRSVQRLGLSGCQGIGKLKDDGTCRLGISH